MEEWGKDRRKDVFFADIDQLVSKDHLLRKIEKVMDYNWLYQRLERYYCHDSGRPGTDPVRNCSSCSKGMSVVGVRSRARGKGAGRSKKSWSVSRVIRQASSL